MSVKIEELIKQIEVLRLELVKTKVGRTYSDPEVITASQKLDEVLNEYHRLVKLNKNEL